MRTPRPLDYQRYRDMDARFLLPSKAGVRFFRGVIIAVSASAPIWALFAWGFWR